MKTIIRDKKNKQKKAIGNEENDKRNEEQNKKEYEMKKII